MEKETTTTTKTTTIKPHDLDYVDDTYFNALIKEEEEGEEIFPTSDAKYSEQLQLQEVLMGSITFSSSSSSSKLHNNKITTPPLSSSTIIIGPDSEFSPLKTIITLSDEKNTQELGESSLSFCEICAERKDNNELFNVSRCQHSFCSDCLTQHVRLKVRESGYDHASGSRRRVVDCMALNCEAVVELEWCRGVVSKEVMDLWEEALCHDMIGEAERFYCPFKDCSGMLVVENGGEVFRESECPYCHRLFCASCCVAWHSGVVCEEYQKLIEDESQREDLMMVQLAKDKKWTRCPMCMFFVERIDGCPHMTCRCKFEFCYGCGSQWSQSHGSCQGN